ncbi:hypothetical protein V6N13_042153 [Hibiscus sabdariffa]|uniref:Uncharacterized protein n=1 Tax=Hibiscus sabdariffa TaxID=183260 RepID=A0ABR2DE64_9ROSI
MIVWEVSFTIILIVPEDVTFCGVFNGHGPRTTRSSRCSLSKKRPGPCTSSCCPPCAGKMCLAEHVSRGTRTDQTFVLLSLVKQATREQLWDPRMTMIHWLQSKLTVDLKPDLPIGILLAISGQAVAARDMPKNDDQMMHPEFLKHDRSVLIPGLGRVLLPPVLKHHHAHTVISGGHIGFGGGHSGSTTGGSSQIPGGDDTFVPNPGFEVPIPGGSSAASP